MKPQNDRAAYESLSTQGEGREAIIEQAISVLTKAARDHDLFDLGSVELSVDERRMNVEQLGAHRLARAGLLALLPLPETRAVAVEEAAKVAEGYAAKLSELQNENNSGVTAPEMWGARINVANYVAVLIRALNSPVERDKTK